MKDKDIARFEKFFTKSGKKKCWEWKGTLVTYGYGCFFLKGYGNSDRGHAHRISYLFYKGKIKKGLFVCHKCDNPKCVNPNHLFLGTQGDNVRDCVRKNRRHERGMTPKKVRDIITGKFGRCSCVEIGKLLGVSADCVRDVKYRRTWKHIIS